MNIFDYNTETFAMNRGYELMRKDNEVKEIHNVNFTLFENPKHVSSESIFKFILRKHVI